VGTRRIAHRYDWERRQRQQENRNEVSAPSPPQDVFGEDLGRAAARVQQAIRDAGQRPERVNVTVRGQVEPMNDMFGAFRLGLFVAIGVILVLLTANFQSFRLAVAVVLTAPAVISGVAIALWLTHTTLNIQSFMGAIMAVGIAVANAILLITFAERSRIEGEESAQAALVGASSRLRPIHRSSEFATTSRDQLLSHGELQVALGPSHKSTWFRMLRCTGGVRTGCVPWKGGAFQWV
jgi:multidrug efflux pump subunit AcrB